MRNSYSLQGHVIFETLVRLKMRCPSPDTVVLEHRGKMEWVVSGMN